jgi:hypothetical protein
MVVVKTRWLNRTGVCNREMSECNVSGKEKRGEEESGHDVVVLAQYAAKRPHHPPTPAMMK